MNKPANNLEGLIFFGYCPYAHGIKGAFTFIPVNSEDSFLEKGLSIFLKGKNSTELKAYDIEGLSKGNKWILTLKGVADRNSVDGLTPCEVYVERAKFPALKENVFYFTDLMELDVYDFSNGDLLGKTQSFYHNGAQYVIVIKTKSEDIELPYTKYFFPEINIGERKILVRVPEVVSE